MILKFLLPIGFLALLALILLLIIYIIKVQYKMKKVTSTYIWKKVLAKQKKRLPLLNNFLHFLIQTLIICFLSLSLAQPFLFTKNATLKDNEHIFIIDNSSSMKTINQDSTRFNKAKDALLKDIDKHFDNHLDGMISLIVADDDPDYLFSNLKKENKKEIDLLIENLTCSSTSSNIEKALLLAKQRLDSNPSAKIFLYSDKEINNLGDAFTSYNFADFQKEWNIGILDCTSEIVDNEYVFSVDLASYGNISQDVNMQVEIVNAENNDQTLHNYILNVPLFFKNSLDKYEDHKTISFKASDEIYNGKENWFFSSFEYVKLSLLNLNDSYQEDNQYYLYGGIKDRIKIEYWSKESKVFWQYGFNNMANNMKEKRQITFKQIYDESGNGIENQGYDFYIFEGCVPSQIIEKGLPNDGVLLLVNPDASLDNLNIGLTYENEISLANLSNCTSKVDNPILNYIDYQKIGISKYIKLNNEKDSDFLPILMYNDDPLIYLKNTSTSKILVLNFSISMSNFYGKEFQIFLYNLLNYFLPVTLEKFNYEVNSEAIINCKGEKINVVYDNKIIKEINTFPSTYTFEKEGIYTFITKFSSSKSNELRSVYVRASKKESSIFENESFDIILNNQELKSDYGIDLFYILGISLLVLLLLDWYLQFKYII